MWESVEGSCHEACNIKVSDFRFYPYGENLVSSVIVSEINPICFQFEDSIPKSKHKFYFDVEILKEFRFIYEV